MFRVRCPSCDKKIKVVEKLFGQKVACKCGHVLRMPSGPDDESDPSTPIQFSCTACRRKLNVKPDLAGRIVKCHCDAEIQVPTPVRAVGEPVVAIPVAEAFDDLLAEAVEPLDDPLDGASPMMSAQSLQNPHAAPAKTSGKNWEKTQRRVTRSDVQQVIEGQKL